MISVVHTLQCLDYWFDTEQEVLDAMAPDERADHERMHKMIKETLSQFCPSCHEPVDHPSGDGCAAMTRHKGEHQ